MPRSLVVRLFLSAAAIGLGFGVVSPGARAASLNLYSAQHEQTVDLLTKEFTKETGIDVKVHSGEAPELASQLVKEGRSSPADVFFTENSPELELLSEKGLLAKVAPATLASVPAQDSGSAGDWVGVLARENVLAYNPGMIQETALPASLLDLAKPEWKGKVAIAPTDADFLPLVGAIAAMKGRPAALEWLKGRGRGRDHQQLLLGAAQHGKRRKQNAERHSPLCRRRCRRIDECLRRGGAQEFAQPGGGAEVPGLPGQQAGPGAGVETEHHLRVSAGSRRGREPDAEADERIAAAVPDPQADWRRPRRCCAVERGGPDLMSQVASLNGAGRAFGFGPPAQAIRRGRAPAGLIAAAAFAAVLVLLPILVTVVQAAGVSAQGAVDLLLRPLVGRLLVNTVGLVVAASATCAVIGTATAWLVERTDVPGRKVWAVLAVAPLAIPPFISSYAWVSLSNGLQDFGGALLVVTCAYYPLVYLPVAAALRGLDPGLEETARSLGHGAWGCFFRVVAPQLRPALYGGVLLVALDVLIEFGAFALLRFRTFTTELYAQYRTGLDGPESSVLALVLIALCLICVVGELNLRGRARYARVGSGSRRIAAPVSLGWIRQPALLAFVALTTATIGVPLGMIGYWLMQHAQAATSPVAPSWPVLFDATLASVGYGLAGAAAALVLAAPVAYLATRYPSRLSIAVERIAYLAQGVPAIVVALAFISLTVQTIRPLYQSAALLVIAYAILFLPFALVGVRSALAQVQLGLEEAGRSLGLGWFGVTVRVLAPMAGPGVGAGAAMVFVFVATELTATLLLAPIGTRTLATEVWANTTSLAFAAAAPFAAMMLAISLLSTWLLAHRFGAAAFPVRV
jgi:iron(III) transport system permease protein